jgi:hypothetical protein
LAGETEVLAENLFHCHSVNHKSQFIGDGIEEALNTETLKVSIAKANCCLSIAV